MKEPVLVTSKLLRAPHGFSTRNGGVSTGPFASLNLGDAVGDLPAHVLENARRLAHAAGLPLERLFTVSQVHGATVLEAVGSPKEVLGREAEADALWTRSRGAWLGIKTADCVPILIEDASGTRVAAVHSGWKGTVADICARTVDALVAGGAEASLLRAAVGPCIQRCCYEVSAELAQTFTAKFGAQVVTPGTDGANPRLDLSLSVARTLEQAGVPRENIDVLRRCTACEPADFFSHRRDAGRTGRHLSFIAPRS